MIIVVDVSNETREWLEKTAETLRTTPEILARKMIETQKKKEEPCQPKK